MNALNRCKGLATRIRNKDGKIEESIIDFFVVCKRVLHHVTDVIIDNKRNNTITNYRGKKRGRKAVDSDHMTLILNLNLNILPQKQQKIQMLDFKNSEGQGIFKKKIPHTGDKASLD